MSQPLRQGGSVRFRAAAGRWLAGAAAALLLAAGPVAQALDLLLTAVPSGAGTVVPTALYNLSTGTVRTIQAYANLNYAFARWDGDVETVANVFTNVTTVRMSNDYYITAVFVSTRPTYTLTLTTDGNGTTDPSGTATTGPGDPNYPWISILADPNPDYVFSSWSGASGVENPNAASTRVNMDGNKTVQANFRRVYTLEVRDNGGPGSSTYTVNLLAGVPFTVAVSNTIAPGGPDYQWRCNGWDMGLGDIPGIGTLTSYGPFNPSASSRIRWTWFPQFRLTLSATAGGTTVPDPGDHWYDSNSIVVPSPLFAPGYKFSGWTGDTNCLGTLTLTMNRSWNVTANFKIVGAETDGDGLPDAWEERWGLDPLSANGVNGRNGDPDNDKLGNLEEFLIPTNSIKPDGASPISADTDDDGIDDAYERNSLDSGSVTSNPYAQFITAVTDDGSYNYDNGPDGNPDGDFLWSTETGYVVSNMPLTTTNEWVGPDRVPPCRYVTYSPGDAGYPLTSTSATNPVKVAVWLTAADGETDDQSRANRADTDGDAFDDGFEYAWDRWHQAHQGELILNTNGMGTNWWPTITQTVPAWDGAANTSRRFNPKKRYGDPLEGTPDYDRWYDQENGRASGYYTPVSEHRASEFAAGLNNPYPVVRRFPPPGNPPWCTNPFLWDTDGDGMPDGWEMSFGFDPWSIDSDTDGTPDGSENPDGDWYARDGALKHHDVYLVKNMLDTRDGYDPRVTINYMPPDIEDPAARPYSQEYINREEFVGRGMAPDLELTGTNSYPTHPWKIDSDADGMWDGWELYVGLDPQSTADAGTDPDHDELRNIQEFMSYNTSTNIRAARTYLVDWRNKMFPTDPFDNDTDQDQITDGGEKTRFNYLTEPGEIVGVADTNATGETAAYFNFSGNGLNPTTVDTDGDFLPDYWESFYAGTVNASNGVVEGGMDGTQPDAFLDYDNDGLFNYQEYMVGCIYHWQYLYNNGSPGWVPGGRNGDYWFEPYDFFDWTLSRTAPKPWGDAMVDAGGRRPKVWDPHLLANSVPRVPFSFITAAEPPTGARLFSTTDPRIRDTDEDGMDDYYEAYHMLDPIYSVDDRDLVWDKVIGIPGLAPPDLGNDPRAAPPVMGNRWLDWDQDGLPNIDESVQPNSPAPEYYHTDPSPYWMSDLQHPLSWATLYYHLGMPFAHPMWRWWFWDRLVMIRANQAPSYMFNFEINDGFDTDSDNYGDRAELVDTPGVSPGQTDPLNTESPIKRRALYLNGDACARVYAGDLREWPRLRTFTVEAWVRPTRPAKGEPQVVVERVAAVQNGNPLAAGGVRANFRLGLDESGRPFVGYHGMGFDPIYCEAKASVVSALLPNKWYHLAGVYDGTNKVLKLFIDDHIAATTPTAEMPFNGWIGGVPTYDPISPFVPPVNVVGARDSYPDGVVDGMPILVYPYLGLWPHRPGPALTRQDPVLDQFFEGWVDEVRIWDGTRTDSEVINARFTRMTRARIAAAEQTRTAEMMYCYGFDDMFDPDTDYAKGGVAPMSYELLDGYPFETNNAYSSVYWWERAPDRSTVYDQLLYVPWIENLATHEPLDPAADTLVAGWATSNRYPNTSNPYTWEYLHGTRDELEYNPLYGFSEMETATGDFALGPHHRAYGDMLPLRQARADEHVEMWDGGGAPATKPYDSDGDGMPDEWEEAYGLNPLLTDGLNGMYGDLDGDGLANLYEYFAGTRPNLYDSYGRGFSDFFNWTSTFYRVYGEQYSDHDGMEDYWETQNGLDPRRYDSHYDADADGWSNLSEFLANSDPQNRTNYPIPFITFRIRYAGLRTSGDLIINAYHTALMDGPPDAIFGTGDLPTIRVLNELLSVSGLPAYAGILDNANIVPGTLSIGDVNHVFIDVGNGQLLGTWPGSGGTIDYEGGAWTLVYTNPAPPGQLITASYEHRDVVVSYPGDVNFMRVDRGYLREGDNWFFAFIDRNGNQTWDPGEPAGVAQNQPVNVGWSRARVDIGLTDTLPGYARFNWVAATDQNSYDVRIRNTAGKMILTRAMHAPRTYFHEGDFRLATYTGLSSLAGYQWYVYTNAAGPYYARGSFTVNYPATLIKPTLVYPVGARINYARDTFVWRMDTNATRARVIVRSGSAGGPVIFDQRFIPPFREVNGTCQFPFPVCFGDKPFTNGVYWWRLQAINPRTNSPLSDAHSFTLDLRRHPQGPSTLSGNLYYFGKVTNRYFLVQAFESPDFSGRPQAQKVVWNKSKAAAWPTNTMAYTLDGLPAGQWFARAFLDQQQDKKPQVWESRGVVPIDPYRARALVMPPDATNQPIYVMMTDTDNDKIADDWEWQYMSSLSVMGPGPVSGPHSEFGYTDSFPTAPVRMNDFERYAYTPMNLSPLDPNPKGPDGIPLRVKNAFGVDLFAPYTFSIDAISMDRLGRPVVTWKAFGNGTPTGAGSGIVLAAAGSTIRVTYQVQFSTDLKSWTNVQGVGVVYDQQRKSIGFVDALNPSRKGFYRYRVTWTE